MLGLLRISCRHRHCRHTRFGIHSANCKAHLRWYPMGAASRVDVCAVPPIGCGGNGGHGNCHGGGRISNKVVTRWMTPSVTLSRSSRLCHKQQTRIISLATGSAACDFIFCCLVLSGFASLVNALINLMKKVRRVTSVTVSRNAHSLFSRGFMPHSGSNRWDSTKVHPT
jgi:hypothetical protein